VRFIILLLSVLVCSSIPARTQEPRTNGTAPQGEFFSGSVTVLSSDKVTVLRAELGKNVTRTFVITPETKIEGKPRVKSRVTVRFVPADDGDRAVHIIVRTSTPKK